MVVYQLTLSVIIIDGYDGTGLAKLGAEYLYGEPLNFLLHVISQDGHIEAHPALSNIESERFKNSQKIFILYTMEAVHEKTQKVFRLAHVTVPVALSVN